MHKKLLILFFLLPISLISLSQNKITKEILPEITDKGAIVRVKFTNNTDKALYVRYHEKFNFKVKDRGNEKTATIDVIDYFLLMPGASNKIKNKERDSNSEFWGTYYWEKYIDSKVVKYEIEENFGAEGFTNLLDQKLTLSLVEGVEVTIHQGKIDADGSKLYFQWKNNTSSDISILLVYEVFNINTSNITSYQQLSSPKFISPPKIKAHTEGGTYVKWSSKPILFKPKYFITKTGSKSVLQNKGKTISKSPISSSFKFISISQVEELKNHDLYYKMNALSTSTKNNIKCYYTLEEQSGFICKYELDDTIVNGYLKKTVISNPNPPIKPTKIEVSATRAPAQIPKPPTPNVAPKENDLTKKLKKLKTLYENELITEEEYNKKRKELLETL